MDLPPLVLQTAGSLVAILALAGLAWWMRLGGTPVLDSEAAVQRAAGEVEEGFVPARYALSVDGATALARDGSGRIMVIKRHGNRFAGRVLGTSARSRIEGERLTVDCGEARFGTVLLTIPDGEAWADAINRVNVLHDA